MIVCKVKIFILLQQNNISVTITFTSISNYNLLNIKLVVLKRETNNISVIVKYFM